MLSETQSSAVSVRPRADEIPTDAVYQGNDVKHQ